MKTIVLKELAILASGILLVSACSSPAPQQSAPPSSVVDQTVPTTALTTAKPEVSINAVMVALVDHAAHQLWDVEAEGRRQRPTQPGV